MLAHKPKQLTRKYYHLTLTLKIFDDSKLQSFNLTLLVTFCLWIFGLKVSLSIILLVWSFLFLFLKCLVFLPSCFFSIFRDLHYPALVRGGLEWVLWMFAFLFQEVWWYLKYVYAGICLLMMTGLYAIVLSLGRGYKTKKVEVIVIRSVDQRSRRI